MLRFVLPLEGNVKGADTTQLIYNAINVEHSALGFTKDNSMIILVQGYGNPLKPNETIIVLRMNDDRSNVKEFIYERHDINDLLSNPVFTSSEIDEIKEMDSSELLLEFMATKFNKAWTPLDFWIQIYGFPFCGGETHPNWLMESRYNSLFWCGELVVWLHSETDPIEEPILN